MINMTEYILTSSLSCGDVSRVAIASLYIEPDKPYLVLHSPPLPTAGTGKTTLLVRQNPFRAACSRIRL